MISPLNTSPETFPPCSRQGEETPETTVRPFGGPYPLSKTKANYSKSVHTKKKHAQLNGRLIWLYGNEHKTLAIEKTLQELSSQKLSTSMCVLCLHLNFHQAKFWFTFTNLPKIVQRSGMKREKMGEQQDARPIT